VDTLLWFSPMCGEPESDTLGVVFCGSDVVDQYCCEVDCIWVLVGGRGNGVVAGLFWEGPLRSGLQSNHKPPVTQDPH